METKRPGRKSKQQLGQDRGGPLPSFPALKPKVTGGLHTHTGHIVRARCASVFAKASTRQAAQSRKRVPSFMVAVKPGRNFTKYLGEE
jgi:hypothetical protein